MNTIYFDEIDSTNSYLKREYVSLSDQTLVYTKHQTKGKGRLGRVWQDDSNSLLFSILLKKDIQDKKINLLPLLTGVSLFETLNELGIVSQIKWPNDVLIKDKKCAGILLESIYESKLDALILGIGVNLNNKSFPLELKDKATSLFLETKQLYEKEPFLEIFIRKFEQRYQKFLQNDFSFIDILKKNSYLDNKKVKLNYYNEDKVCHVIQINDDGTLKVKDEEGKIYDMNSGEVTLEKNYH